jgi:hypothetical protein
MPRISAFYGIVINMYFTDHMPPHFHATYAEYEASVDIMTCNILKGSLPRRARALVREWADLHRNELLDNWRKAEKGIPLDRIEPLR